MSFASVRMQTRLLCAFGAIALFVVVVGRKGLSGLAADSQLEETIYHTNLQKVDLTRQLSESFAAWMTVHKQVVALASDGKRSSAATLSFGAARDRYNDVTKQLTKLVAAAEASAKASDDRIDATTAATRSWMLIFCAGGVILAMGHSAPSSL